MEFIIVALTFISTWALIFAILFSLFNKEKPIDKLKYYDEDFIVKEKYQNKRNKGSLLKIISKIIPNLNKKNKKVKGIEIELMKADIPITVEELLALKLFSSFVLGFLIFACSKNLVLFILTFFITWNVPRFIIASKKKERIKLFDSQLNEGITIISNSLKAGYSFLQAVAVVTEETKDPFAKEFKKLLKEMSFGVSDDESFKNLLERMESEDLRLIINAILIQKDIGGNLSEILDNISETIRERQKIKNELKTLTAQGKLSGIIVMLIPIFLGATIYLFNKDYIMLLFTTSTGLGMIGFAVFNQILGIVMIKKIINIDM